MIFESPNGNKTVYPRLDQLDITVNPESLELNHLWFQWRDILTAAKTNPALKEALDKAHIIYELSRNDKS